MSHVRRNFKIGLLSAALAIASMHTAIAQTQTNVKALKRIASEATKRFKTTQAENLRLAKLLGIPLREELPNGVTREIWKFVNGKPLYYMTTNLGAANTVSASKLWPGGASGLDLDGSGVVLGEWDAGVARQTHQEYAGRVIVTDGSGLHDHSAHVAGTMIASGIVGNAKGMSFRGEIHGYDWNNDSAEMADEASRGLLLSNHSYGSWGDPIYYGMYEAGCVERDNISYNAPYYLICQAAGNSQSAQTGGYDTIILPAAAKNSLTVGAVYKNTYTDPSSVLISNFSSCGPTDDGRIKPDIVSPGVNLYSTLSGSDTAYGYSSGTSMATPTACGALGLITQYYSQLYPGQNMLASTLKALAIHTADEAGPADGPDYRYGWGQLNVASMAFVLRDRLSNPDMIQVGTLAQGRTFEYTAPLDGGQPIKVTVVWTDPPGEASYNENDRTPRLVNDLDLRVEINGETYEPWVLDPDNPSAPATRGDNYRDNVEQVVVPATEGVCKITISHKGAVLKPSGSQAFSLIITGLRTPRMTGFTITPDRVVGGTNAVGRVTLDGSAPVGGALVTITSSDRSIIKTPATVRIPAGQLSASFAIKTSPVVDAKTGTVTASYREETFESDLTVCPPGLMSFTVDPTSIDGGNTVTGTVELSLPAPEGGAIVRVASDQNKVATVDWKVFVPAGETTATFPITTFPVSKVTTVRLRAAYPGPTRYATLVVNPPFVLSSLSLSRSSIKGGGVLFGTVTMARPASVDTQVDLSSSMPGVASVPSTVTIPAGASSVSFNITTSAVTATKNVAITASYQSVVKTVNLKVTK